MNVDPVSPEMSTLLAVHWKVRVTPVAAVAASDATVRTCPTCAVPDGGLIAVGANTCTGSVGALVFVATTSEPLRYVTTTLIALPVSPDTGMYESVSVPTLSVPDFH